MIHRHTGAKRETPITRLVDRISCWVAYRLPRKIIYWSAIRIGAHATTGPHSHQVVPELPFMDALKRWDEQR